MRYRFVINSSAGRLRLDFVRALIDREFADLPHEVVVDPSAARLEALCDPSRETDRLTIVVVGGDGTVNRVVNTPVHAGRRSGSSPWGRRTTSPPPSGFPPIPRPLAASSAKGAHAGSTW